MMKIQRIRMIWAAAVLLAAGCSQEQGTDEASYSDVLIAPRSSVAEGKIRPLTDDGATRAAVDGITQNLTFYFQRVNEKGLATGAYYPYENKVLPAVRAGGAGPQSLTFTPPLAYLASGAKSKLTGWYPEADSFAYGVVTWTLDGTQDVLTAAAQAGSKTSPMPILEFKHRLSQLHFRFQAESVKAQTVWGAITEILVLKQPAVCRYTPETDEDTGNVTFDAGPIADFEAKNIKTGVVPTTPTAMCDPMMIVPQTATRLTIVIRTATGKEANAVLTETTYDPGKAYNVNILLKEEVDFTGNASVGTWGALVENTQRPIVPMEKEINLSEKGTANCYVVTATNAGGYYFDATKRGNNATGMAGINYGMLPILTMANEARVIWQTGTGATTGLVVDPATLKLEDGKVFFNTGTATEGNAVIGLFAFTTATAPCLWSWHIWRVDGALPADVDCVKTPSPTTASANFKMMALNLGAFNNATGDPKSIGLMYQWGRKDPFPGPKDFTNTEPTNIYGSISNNGTVRTWNGTYSVQAAATSSTIGTEAWAVQYPGVFIYNSSSPYDWMATKNDNLWGTPWVAAGNVGGYNGSQGTKSIYDPCPVGYRVPPQDTWNQAVKDGSFTNGWAFTGLVSSGSFWFPAAGLRWGDVDAGKLSSSDGYYWSSSVYSLSTYGGSLIFNNSGVNRLGNRNRTSGFSVRCVRE